ncbi:hypothetical protein F511_34629 [Dorcoceras hygrometricum]|uniref:Uncharacterized protein n=1 Tax=Dorcoceras hygrometricum TaxID=472368 RepID=A0A2Z7AF97_9LAMI|nr:hypothetical protein F511_34629 [Dorcoceras hygrometricum]
MKKLLERSPTLPRTYQTTAGNNGNSPERLTMNSALGFEKQRTNVEENILSTNKPADAKNQLLNTQTTLIKTMSQRLNKTRTIGQQLRVPQLANHSLQKWYRMKELLERSPTLPRTYQTTAGNNGNSPERLTMNNALSDLTKRRRTAYIIKSATSWSPKTIGWFLSREFPPKAALTKTTTHSLRHPVASSRAKKPDAGYSNHHQSQATVANKSLAAGQPVATSKRRRANLSKRCRFALNEQNKATAGYNTLPALTTHPDFTKTTAFRNLALPKHAMTEFHQFDQLSQ